jgi:hypothetical protein
MSDKNDGNKPSDKGAPKQIPLKEGRFNDHVRTQRSHATTAAQDVLRSKPKPSGGEKKE